MLRRITAESTAINRLTEGYADLLNCAYQSRLDKAGVSDVQWLPKLILRRLKTIGAGLDMAHEYITETLSIRNLVVVLFLTTLSILVSFLALAVTLVSAFKTSASP